MLQNAGVDRIFENPENHIGAPLGALLNAESRIVTHTLGQLVVHGRRDSGVGQPGGNVDSADTVQLPVENVPYHVCGELVNHQLVMVTCVLFVAENGKGADEISALAFDFKLAPNFYRRIPAICLIDKILEGDKQLIGFHMAVHAVKMVVDGNKPNAKEREIALDVLPGLQVVPAEPGEVFDHNAVDFPSFGLRNHLLKPRPLKI